MARKRMIDPSLWQDEGMAELSPRQQLLYIGMISNADDDGRLKGSASAIRLMLPTIYVGCGLSDIEQDIEAVLVAFRQLVRYDGGGRTFIAFRNYRKWQKIERPSPSILPPPPEDSVSHHRTLTESSPIVRSQVKLSEEKLEEEKGREHPPTPQQPTPIRPAAAPPERAEKDPPGFAAFWQAWPKKEGKAEALAKWRKLRPDPDTIQTILDAIPRQQAAKDWPREGWRYCPLPATWLNQRRWEDEIPDPPPKGERELIGKDKERAEVMRRVLARRGYELPGTDAVAHANGSEVSHQPLRVGDGRVPR